MMGLSVVLPEEEGGTWRWYTNQGVERARPPPKPNDEWYHQGSGEDEGTTTAPYRSHLFSPPYNNKLEWYTNQGDDAGRVRPPPKPNEGAMMDLGQRPSMGYLYHPIAHDDWSCVPAPSPPNYNDGTTSTAPHQWYTNQGDDVERVRPPPKPNDEWYHQGSSGEDEGTTAPSYRSHFSPPYNNKWTDNQGDDVGRDVERARPPPKPNNEGQRWYYHHSTAHDWYHVTPASSPAYVAGITTTAYDGGLMTLTPPSPQRWLHSPQYDGSTNTNDKSNNGGQWWYHSTYDGQEMTSATASSDEQGTTTTTDQPYYVCNQYDHSSNNHLNRGTTNQCTGGANHHGHHHHQPTIDRHAMMSPPTDPRSRPS